MKFQKNDDLVSCLENFPTKKYFLDRDFNINELSQVVLSFKNFKSRGDDKVF